MPPSPGRIHSLPVKVLYSIDTSSQSFFTVLPDRQDIYVHPTAGADEQGPRVGSCTLKVVGRGICFASPECIPNPSTLDFSVYTLDPSASSSSSSSRRNVPPTPARAFSPSESPSSSSSWTGRGFLSWALSEPGQGQTLVKGRLVREYEFASTHFAAEGGLEGLMAAAQSQSRGANAEDADGKGWGLQVSISLRQLNPEGKVEFQGRREFEDMLAHGKSLSVAGTSPAATSPAMQRSSPHPHPLSHSHSGRAGPGAATPVSNPQTVAGPSSAATVRPALAHPSPVLSRPSSSMSHRPSFSSTLPPSSIPPGPSSSASNLPSSRPSSAADSRPIKNEPSVEPSRSHSSREVTPPPVPRPKSPPPSTPSRARLHALLRADGAMSPDLARHLASNPVLRNLLKAVPSNSNAFAALRNIAGINNPAADEKGKQKATRDAEERDESPEQATTPTPIANVRSLRSTTEGCCNCGTMQSNCWRTKKMKDGTPRKVCDDCGLYFNKHKRMRPPELWGPSDAESSSKPQTTETKRKAAHVDIDGPAAGLRSSPRLNRTNSDSTSHTVQHQNLPAPPESPRKRQKTKAVPQPSPRMATRASAKADAAGGVDFSAEAFGFSPNTIFGTSPPDANGTSNGMGSIGSVMANMNFSQPLSVHSTHSTHSSHSHQIPGAAVGLLGPHDTNGHNNLGGGGDEFDISALLASMESAAAGMNEGFNFDSLFAGFGDDPSTNTGTAGAGGFGGTGTADGAFDLSAGGAGTGGMGNGHVELSQEMMDLLAGWEGQIVAGLEADAQQQQQPAANGANRANGANGANGAVAGEGGLPNGTAGTGTGAGGGMNGA